MSADPISMFLSGANALAAAFFFIDRRYRACAWMALVSILGLVGGILSP